MKTKKLLFYLLAGLLGGCVPVMSLHRLYTKENVVFEEKLLGIWVDDSNETTWEFKRVVDESDSIYKFKRPDESEKAYELVFYNNEDGTKGSFFAHLVKLENRLFLDVFPNQFPSEQQDWEKMNWAYNFFFFESAHTFIKIDSIKPQLKMRRTVSDDMKKLLKEDPNVVKHEFVEDRLILTASTKELQAFVLKYADDDRVFAEEIVLTPEKPKDPNTPNGTDPNDRAKQK